MDRPHENRNGRYAAYGVAAYGLWGLIPLYFKTVAEVSPLEILAHRAVWSFLVLAMVVRLEGRSDEVRRNLCNLKLLLVLALSASLIAGNWLTFIYAVWSNQVLQSSLGYFISPLVNVLLGMLFLRERLRPWQTLAIVLAAAGFVILAGVVGELPWIALMLALTAGFHLLLRKVMPVDGLISLAMETVVMAPFALAYLGYLGATEQLTGDSPRLLGLLMLSGPVTSVPFLFFGAAARRLRLATMGILQYLTPTLHFTLAVLVFKETFTTAQLLSFACVWTAVAIYAADAYRGLRQVQPDADRDLVQG